MRADANRIALRAVRAILDGNRPAELDVGGTRVSCQVSLGRQGPWPEDAAALTVEHDGPEWPTPVIVDCAWTGGRCRLSVEAAVSTHPRYLHDVCLAVRLADNRRQLCWVDIANEVEDVDDGGTARLEIRAFLTPHRDADQPEKGQRINDALRELLSASGLPLRSRSAAELCAVEVPSAEIMPGKEIAFQRLVHVALLKLDFLDRGGKARDRGTPLVDLRRWGIEPDGLPAVDDSEDENDVDLGQPPQYWAGGWPQDQDVDVFIDGNYWKSAYSRTTTKRPGKRVWKYLARVRVGDYLAIKGLGGQHDLVIHYVGQVTSIDLTTGRLDLRRVDVPLYKGKAPTGRGAGNWHDTLVPVTRAKDIATIFGTAALGVSEAPSPAPAKEVTVPLNLILYGPPGTGKTFRITHDLVGQFERAPTATDSLAELVAELTWYEVIALALNEMGGKAKVPELAQQRLIKAKHAGSAVTRLAPRLWSTLQLHTVAGSQTVKYERRADPPLFDKKADSTWVLVKKLPDEIQEVADQLAAPVQAAVSKDHTFVTFHQSFGYEDFIEGIRPNLEAATDGDEAKLTYRIEDGVFMKAVRAALRLTGYDGSLDELCKLPRDERGRWFAGAPHYALFIDEINRGNVARIFGELITLLEEDKRLGEENEIIVRLPCSKTLFGVPPNLHVIGTMNTADRSIEALDTALRRRFEFEELPPLPDKLDFTIEGDIEPDEMLRTINHRLERLYDRDHCIGHAYLLALEDDPTLDNLKLVFRHKLIPLLQEYFFGDWGKIGLVLGKDFVRRKDPTGRPFADFEHDDHDALAERPTWEIADVSKLSSFAFRRIYEHVADD